MVIVTNCITKFNYIFFHYRSYPMQYGKFQEIPLSTQCLQKISHVHWTSKKKKLLVLANQTLIFLPQIIGLLALFIVEMQPKTKRHTTTTKLIINTISKQHYNEVLFPKATFFKFVWLLILILIQDISFIYTFEY